MVNIITIIHVLAAIALIGLILVQHGKGADMGAAFGSGASGSLFGVSGSTNFLSRATSISVAVFFAASLALAYLAANGSNGGSVVKAPAIEKTIDSEAAGSEAASPAAETVGADSVPNDTAPVAGTAEDVPN